jgi:radical SAM protein with 4Fe4S-binding SPASM domain
MPRPDYFGIEVTRRCNLHCPHCFTDAGGKNHPGPTTEALSDLLGRLARAGARTVAFSGGEPLLRRDLEQVMDAGRRAGIESFTLVSNGFFAEPARVRSLEAAGLVGVQISVDGVDAKDHAAVRGCSPIDFYRALGAIRGFREVGITVDVACIISRQNVERAAEMALLCEALGVRSLRYCSFVPTGRAVDRAIAEPFEVEPERLDRFLALLREIRAQPDAPIGVLTDHGIGPWQTGGEFRCDAGESVAYISAEGDLYPCPGSIFAPFVVGNVFSTPIEELLASPKLACVRSIERRELDEPCRSCQEPACSGGCRGAAFARTGDPRAAPHYCNVRRRDRR